MAQLADYRASVRALGYDGLTDAQVDVAIQQARRRVFQDRRWSFLEAGNTSLSTANGVATVSLAAITDLAHLDSVRHTTAQRDPLAWRPYQILRDLRQNHPDDSGPPEYWTRYNGALLLWPTPDAAYALDIAYIKYPGDLVAATNDTVPDRYRDLVTWGAVIPLAFRQREFQAASSAENVYDQLLAQYFALDATEQRQTSRQVISGYWD